MADEKETIIDQSEETETLSPEQEAELVKNELAVIPTEDKNEVQRIVKPKDVVTIGLFKSALTKFKRRFPATKFVFDITKFDPKDKELRDKAEEAWQEMKNFRTKKIQPTAKELKAPLNALLKYYNDTFNPLIEDFKKAEAAPGDFVDAWDKALEDYKQKEKRAQEERTRKRVDELIKTGAAFDGSYYSIGHEEFGVATISLGQSDINSMTDETYNLVLDQIKIAAATITTKQKEKDDAAEKERLQKQAEAEENKRIVEQLKAKQKTFRVKELKFAGMVYNEKFKQYECEGVVVAETLIDTAEDPAWEELIANLEEKIEAAKNAKALHERVKTRESQIISYGMVTNVKGDFIASYKDSIFCILKEDIEKADEDKWLDLSGSAIDAINKMIEQKNLDDAAIKRKKELINDRVAKLTPYWQFVTKEEHEKIGDYTPEEFTQLEKEKIAKHDEKLTKDIADKAAKDAKEKADKLAKEGEQAQFDDYVARLKAQPVPEFKTEEFKNKVATLLSFINKY